MKLRLGAAVLLATIVPLSAVTTVTAPSPARAGEVDITPPAIGSCFDLTLKQVRAASNGEPPVACTARHTTVTFDVVEFAEPPDWNDEDSYDDQVYDQCNLSWINVLGGNPKTITRSSYTYYWLLPTPDQREAGASWVRCELALRGGGSLAPVPTKIRLGRLPLPNSVAWCIARRGADFVGTVCTRSHRFRATRSIRIPGNHWRGNDKVQKIALEACQARVSGDFRYSWPPSRYWWRLGFRYATCLPRDR